MNSLTKLNFQQIHLEHNQTSQAKQVEEFDNWDADVVFQKIHNNPPEGNEMAIRTLNASPKKPLVTE